MNRPVTVNSFADGPKEFVVVTAKTVPSDKSRSFHSSTLKSRTAYDQCRSSSAISLKANIPAAQGSLEISQRIRKSARTFLTNSRSQSGGLWGDDYSEDMEDIHQKLLRRQLNPDGYIDDDISGQLGIETALSYDYSSEEGNKGDKKRTIKFNRLYRIQNNAQQIHGLSNVNVESKTKGTLKNLTKFVVGYSNRKIMSSWDLIESKFKSSPHIHMMMEKGPDGISYPVKVRVLHLSTLALLLCSAEIRIKHHELLKLLLELGFTEDDCNKSRKIAACKLVLRTIEDMEKRAKYHKFLDLLLKDGERSVSIAQLKSAIFPTDPVEYAKAMDTIQKARTQRLAQMVEDRRIKAEMQGKAELRRAKLIAEFEQDLRVVQLPKGVLDMSRYLFLSSVIDYARKIVYEIDTAATAGIDPEVIELIGIEMFPRKIREHHSEDTGDDNGGHGDGEGEGEGGLRPSTAEQHQVISPTSSVDSASTTFEKPLFLEGGRITLGGPQPLIPLLRKCVAAGKGLNGNAFADVIELVQSMSSVKIQAVVRGHRRAWRYKKARALWNRREAEIRRMFITAWGATASHYGAIKRLCWRKVKAWQYYTRRNISRRETFRVCFWSFFTWRRSAQETRKAKEKAKFLVGRIMPTILTMKVYRAWKGYSAERGRIHKISANHIILRMDRAVRSHFKWLNRWARRRKRLRRAWYKEGILKFEKNQRICMMTPFLYWKIYVFYKRLVRHRVNTLASHVRKVLMDNGPVRPPLSQKNKQLLVKQRRLKAAEARMNDFNFGVHGRESFSESVSSSSVSSTPSSPVRGGVGPRGSMVINNRGKGSRNVIRQYGDLNGLGLKPVFDWTAKKQKYDIDSDGEYEIDLPRSLMQKYNGSVPHLHLAHQIDFIQEESDLFKSAVNKLSAQFTKVEVWALLESSMIYQRVSARAFKNLRTNAVVRRNMRLATKRRKERVLRACLQRLAAWIKLTAMTTPTLTVSMNANLGMSVKSNLLAMAYDNYLLFNEHFNEEDFDYDMSEDGLPEGRTHAEILAYQSKTHRLEKIQLRKEVVMRIKKAEDEVRKREEECKSPIVANDSSKKNPPSRKNPLQWSIKGDGKFKKGSVTFNLDDPEMKSVASRVIDQVLTISASTNRSAAISKLNDPSVAPPKRLNLTPSAASSVQSPKMQAMHNSGALRRASQVAVARASTSTNILLWDREDREKELYLSQAMSSCSRQMHREAIHAVMEETKEEELQEQKQALKHRAFQDLVRQERLDTEAAQELEMEYASQFKVKAAGVLVDALEKVHYEWILAQNMIELKRDFRALRIPLMEKRSILMRNRKKIVNWIRLCKRLIYISREAPKYYQRRMQWIIFCRWIKLLEKERFNASAGLTMEVRERTAKFLDYSHLLHVRGFKTTIYPFESRMRHYTSDFLSIFRRWQQYTQESKLFQIMKEKADIFYNLRLIQKYFSSMQTSMRFVDTYEKRRKDLPFAIVRAYSDLDQLAKRFIAHRRKSLFLKIRRLTQRYFFCKVRDARRYPTFKRFMNGFRKDCDARIMMEQRLLLEAFESKGRLEFKDIPMKTRMHVPDGIVFSDPIRNGNSDVTELPPGFKISKIKCVLQDGMGVVGWQIIWSGDGNADRESARRGKWNGAASEVIDLSVDADDFVTAVETIFEGTMITALRILCHISGWSKWVGSRVSESAVSAVLSADDVRPDPDSPEIGDEEKKSPGMPRNYITGLTGLQHVTRATALGIVVRRVRSHSVFSYYWVEEAPPPTTLTPLVILKEEARRNSSIFPKLGQSNNDHSKEGRRHYKVAKKDKSDISVLSSITNGSGGEKPELSPSELQFFNVLRMRLTELHAAEGRAVDFARRLWSHPRLSRSTSNFSSITIVPNLTKWFFESLCKYLNPPPLSEIQSSDLKKKARLIRIRSEAIRRRVVLLSSEMNTITYETNPWTIAMLGAKEKKAIQDQKDRQNALQDDISMCIETADQMDATAASMDAQGLLLLPVLQMSTRVCNNFRMKISAARHLSSLMERMDMHTIRHRLAGKHQDNSISSDDMEAIGNRIVKANISTKKGISVQSLNSIIENELKEEREREKQNKLNEEKKMSEIKAAILNKSTDAKTVKELMQKKKTFRKSMTVDPCPQTLSSRPHTTLPYRIVRTPTVTDKEGKG